MDVFQSMVSNKNHFIYLEKGMKAGTIPPARVLGSAMLHLVVGQLSNGVDRIEGAERLERSEEPAITEALDVDEPRIRDLVEAALAHLNLDPELDAQAVGSSCTIAGQTHLYVWWHSPTPSNMAA